MKPDSSASLLGTPTTDNLPVEPVRTPSGQEAELGQIGRSGTYIFNGIITQEEYNADLYRTEALKIYDQMRRSDGTVSAILLACKLPIISVPWSIQPASDDEQDIKIANFVTQELMNRNIQFSDFLREGLTMFDFGYAVAEKVLEMTTFEGEELIGLNSLPFRKQRSVYYWETQEHEPGITQVVLGGTFSIPREKIVIFTHAKEGENYEGISMLRPAYKHWLIKDKLYLIDALKHERQGLGVIGITAPANAHQGDIDKAIEAARNVRANEESYIKAPEGYTIEFMDMHASTVSDPIPSALHHDRQISKSILAQFLELGGSGSSGSRATSQDHSKLFMMSLEATAKNIVSVIQKEVINYLVDLNFSNVKDYPKLDHGRIGDDDMAAFSDAVNKLVSVNALTPDPDMEQSIRTTLHLNDLPDEYREDYNNRPKANAGTPAAPLPPGDPNNPGSPDASNDDGSDITANDALEKAAKARKTLLRAIDNEYATDK